MAVCAAITHNGSRCTSPAASDGGDVCSHHARMARLMALAPSSSAATSAGANGTPPPPAIAAAITTTTIGAPRPNDRVAASSFDMREPVKEFYAIQQNQATPIQMTAVAISASRRGSKSSSNGLISTSSISSSTDHGMAMLPNEGVLAAVTCSYQFPAAVGLPGIPGTLFITTYRLRFEPTNAALRSPGHFHRLLDDALVGIPRACVGKLSYPQVASATRSKYEPATPSQLVIKFKDLRAWTLGGDINTLMMTLNRHVFIESPLSLFAFASVKQQHGYHHHNRELHGHQIYNLHADFARMGVDLLNGPFRVTDVNKNYGICPTYPPQLVVPSTMTDHEIANVAEFRSKGRLPICCFVHPRNSASIWRCAQPKRGILNAQNPADDRHLASIGYSNRQQKRVWIADCRPELNAKVNKFTGGGTESSNHQHASVSFLNIANIHAMRESIENVRGLVTTGNTDLDFSWQSRVEDTKWLSHVRLVLSAALRVADSVENKGTTVLVHCSDGWDRTGQLCALSQMLLDKHYRTIVGFMEIIEKEWIQVGHKFHDRVGPGKAENEEQSPVFLQFLDCVWQLWRQYPTYFEFNGKLLETIADATFSGRYGTFLGNCDRERTAWNLYTRTQSLWTHVLDHKAMYQNPFYRPQASAATGSHTLLPPVSSMLRQVTLWSEYYFRSATLPTNPVGNPSPPLFGAGLAAATAKTNHDDLGFAMGAVLRRIQALEDELREARASLAAQTSAASSSVSVPYTQQQYAEHSNQPPAPVLQPIALPPAPVLQTASVLTAPAMLHPPSLPSNGHFALQTPGYALNNYQANGSSSASSSSSSSSSSSVSISSSSTWSCGICSKLNVSESLKCVVCGRPQPLTQ